MNFKSWFACVALAVVVSGCPAPGPSGWSQPVGPLTPILLSVWGTSPTDVWAVGGVSKTSSYTLHFDGTGWSEVKTPATGILWWVYGFGPKDVWMCGEGATMLHWDGAAFTTMDTKADPKSVLYGVWGPSSSELWSVGGVPDNSSVVLHFAGGQWAPAMNAPVPSHGTWFKVWGSAASDVFIVGQNGSMAHYDGTSFTKVDVSGAGVSAQQPLLTVAGNAANNVFAVGGLGNGLAIHFDGAKWAAVSGVDLSFSPGLMGVSVSPSGAVSITGQSGAKLRGVGATWTDDGQKDPLADLHSTWVFGPDDIFAVGGDFASLKGGVVAHYGQPIGGLK